MVPSVSFNSSLGIEIFILGKTPYCRGFMEGLIYKEKPVYKVAKVEVVGGEVAKVKAPYKESRDPYSATKLRSVFWYCLILSSVIGLIIIFRNISALEILVTSILPFIYPIYL